MILENKELLLKDLCARLPYGVIVHIHDIDVDDFDRRLIGEDLDFIELDRRNCKPYLRPMSSMTEKECIALSHLKPYNTDVWKYIKTSVPLYIANIRQFDFFLSHHLDWRGLIPIGLALEAPEDMYKIE